MLQQLSADPALQDQPLHAFILLATALRELSFDEDKIRVLREAQRGHSQDALANPTLAEALALETFPPQFDEAARHLTAAIAIDRDRMTAQFLLARILHEQGNSVEAATAYKQVISSVPDAIAPHAYYLSLLKSQGRDDEMLAEYRDMVARHGKREKVDSLVRKVYRQQSRRQTMVPRNTTGDATFDFLLREKEAGNSNLQNPEQLKHGLDQLMRALN